MSQWRRRIVGIKYVQRTDHHDKNTRQPGHYDGATMEANSYVNINKCRAGGAKSMTNICRASRRREGEGGAGG